MSAKERRALVYLKFRDEKAAEFHRLSALGINTLFARWAILPAAISDYDPTRCSLNIRIDDFRGDSDLVLLRNLPGVLEVKEFQEYTALPDPMESRREYFQRQRATAAA